MPPTSQELHLALPLKTPLVVEVVADKTALADATSMVFGNFGLGGCQGVCVRVRCVLEIALKG